MILLTFGVTIFGEHTRLTCLETDASILAALSAAAIIFFVIVCGRQNKSIVPHCWEALDWGIWCHDDG
jgi:hypothetical protein